MHKHTSQRRIENVITVNERYQQLPEDGNQI